MSLTKKIPSNHTTTLITFLIFTNFLSNQHCISCDVKTKVGLTEKLSHSKLINWSKIEFWIILACQKWPKFDILTTCWSKNGQNLIFWPHFGPWVANFSSNWQFLERILVKIGQILPVGQNWLQKLMSRRCPEKLLKNQGKWRFLGDRMCSTHGK